VELRDNGQESARFWKQQLKWYRCKNEGQVPKGRDAHSAAIINNKIFIFGGQSLNEELLDDIYCMTLIEDHTEEGIQFTAKWERIDKPA